MEYFFIPPTRIQLTPFCGRGLTFNFITNPPKTDMENAGTSTHFCLMSEIHLHSLFSLSLVHFPDVHPVLIHISYIIYHITIYHISKIHWSGDHSPQNEIGNKKYMEFYPTPPQKTNRTMEKQPWMKIYLSSIKKRWIFQPVMLVFWWGSPISQWLITWLRLVIRKPYKRGSD